MPARLWPAETSNKLKVRARSEGRGQRSAVFWSYSIFSAWSLSCPRGRAGEEVEIFDNSFGGSCWSGRFWRGFFHRRVDCQLCGGGVSYLHPWSAAGFFTVSPA